DLGAAAREYQQTIERSLRDKSPSGYPAFDLILLGMGPDGHTASVFPDYPEDEVGAEDLVADVYVGSKQAHRLTLTPTLINAARHILFLVTGEEKSQAVFETVVDHSTPAARIQPESGRVIFLVDAAAASRLDMSPLANLP
ncbi:MAG: 6-phosphogluconolactonase, partial [Candidatus Zixiibacteriota bacterium]